MDIFVRIKHWQLFLITFGPNVLSLAYITYLNDLTIFGEGVDLPYRILVLIQTISLITTYLWLYVVGVRLHERRPASYSLLNVFKIVLYVCIAYHLANFFMAGTSAPYYETLLIAGTYLSLACRIFSSFFVSRMLKAVEEDRNVPFKDFFGDFLGFIFFPLGMWWLQPRINSVFAKTSETIDPDAPLDQHVKI